jgi:HSP20 family protein
MTGATQELEKPNTNHKLDKQESPATKQNEQALATHEPVNKQEIQAPQGAEHTRTGKIYTPPVDIYETRDAIILLADMPGVDESSVDVTLEKNVLTIYGHVDLPQPAGYQLAYAEYGVGDYRRSFTISNQVDWERIEGIVKAGVLKLTLPKLGPAESKKIAIKPAK